MTDKTVSVYWFLILFIVTFAIVFIVYSLYGKPLDIRAMEGIFLEGKLADCVSQGGRIPSNVLDSEGNFLLTEEKIMGECHLNFDVEEYKDWHDNQFFISVTFFDEAENQLYEVSYGNYNLKGSNSNINFFDSKKEKFPFCVERKIYSNGADLKYYLIKLISCVGKAEKNA